MPFYSSKCSFCALFILLDAALFRLFPDNIAKKIICKYFLMWFKFVFCSKQMKTIQTKIIMQITFLKDNVILLCLESLKRWFICHVMSCVLKYRQDVSIYLCIYIYLYIYGNHKTLISHHGCSYYEVITGQKEQTIFCITFRHLPSSDASFQQIAFHKYTILFYSFSFIIIL